MPLLWSASNATSRPATHWRGGGREASASLTSRYLTPDGFSGNSSRGGPLKTKHPSHHLVQNWFMEFSFNFPNLPFGLARCAAPGLWARGISRAVNPIRNFTIWLYMSSIRIGHPAVATELFALAHGMAWGWEIILLELLTGRPNQESQSILQQEGRRDIDNFAQILPTIPGTLDKINNQVTPLPTQGLRRSNGAGQFSEENMEMFYQWCRVLWFHTKREFRVALHNNTQKDSGKVLVCEIR